MDYKHHHFAHSLLQDKNVIPITEEHPLVAVVCEGAFLQFTLQHLLRINQVPHIMEVCLPSSLDSESRMMKHQMPILVFNDEVLQYLQVVEFVGDLCLGQNQYHDYVARKAGIKYLASSWIQIFNFQRKASSNFAQLKSMGVNRQKDYQNLVMQELLNLSASFKGRGLQKSYAGYSQTDPNPQNIIFADIISTIVEQFPESYPDYYLRAYFPDMLQLGNKMKHKWANFPPNQRMIIHNVVMERPDERPIAQWPLINKNHNKFLITLGIMSLLYLRYVQE